MTWVAQPRGRLSPAARSSGRIPAGAGSVRGHVTAAIRTLRADARLQPRLLAGSTPSRRLASPVTNLRLRRPPARPGAPWQVRAARPTAAAAPGPRAPRPARPLHPGRLPLRRGELQAGRGPPQSCRLAAAGCVASCVGSCSAPQGPERPSRPRGAPGSAWALRRSPRSCFRLLALPPAITVKGGWSSCSGVRGGGELASWGRRSRAPERTGVLGRRPHRPRARTPGRGGARRGLGRPRLGSSAARPGAGRHTEPIFRPLGLGCGKPEPGERPREADPVRWEGVGSLVARFRLANLPPRTGGPRSN